MALVEGRRSFRLRREATPGARGFRTGLVRIATLSEIVDRVRTLQDNSRVAALFGLTENPGTRQCLTGLPGLLTEQDGAPQERRLLGGRLVPSPSMSPEQRSLINARKMLVKPRVA